MPDDNSIVRHFLAIASVTLLCYIVFVNWFAGDNFPSELMVRSANEGYGPSLRAGSACCGFISCNTAGEGHTRPKSTERRSYYVFIRRCLENYANFNGRARRSEYWYFYLFTFIVTTVVTALISWLHITPFLATIVSFALLIPGLAVGCRRLHDIGKSGVYLLFGLIPVIGTILLLVWFVKDSQPGMNQYGISEKYPSVGPNY